MKVYKIFDPERELFSEGGVDAADSDYPWSEKGKTWPRIGALKAHLKQLKKIPSHWLIYEFYVPEPELTDVFSIGKLQ